MTHQIAPSLATELEQAAQKCRDEIASCFADYVEAAREDGRDDAVSEHAKCSGCHSQRTHEALLTRAAALARAAEKVTNFDPIEADFDNQVNYCQFCCVIHGMNVDAAFKHLDDCAWMQLRALVSSEGGK